MLFALITIIKAVDLVELSYSRLLAGHHHQVHPQPHPGQGHMAGHAQGHGPTDQMAPWFDSDL